MAEYAKAHAPVSLRELQQVYGRTASEVREAVAPAERAGSVVRRQLRGMDCWLPAGG
jgi:predicted transcriptional regulator